MIWLKATIVIFITLITVGCEKWYSANDKENINNVKILRSPFHIVINNRTKLYKEIVPTLAAKVTNRDSPNIVIQRYMTNETVNRIWKPLDNVQGLVGLTKEKLSLKRRMRPQRRVMSKTSSTVHHRSKQLSSGKTKSRFLDVFHVVEFNHVICVSSSGLEGVCLPEYKCNNDGGSVMGSCADGYGVCCVTLYSCQGSTDSVTSWFTNPDFPSPNIDRLSCSFTLIKASNEIKQIRLDFLAFEMLPPTAGVCQQDQFVISGQNINSIIPILCGINNGQHVYMEVSDVNGPIILTIQTESAESRLFSIKVSQLTSTHELAAPTGCLQYFQETEGYLESFNYKDTSEIAITRDPSYSNNLNYAMCIQRGTESCSVTYNTAGDMQIVNYDGDGLPIIPPNQAGVEIYNCPSDYLLISAIRLCGERLNDGSVLQDFSLDAPITDNSAGPIVIWFRSDEGYVGRGFKIKYKQNSCTTPEYK